MNDYKPSGKTYEYKTIDDILKFVTLENLDYFITDFKMMLEEAIKMKILLEFASKLTNDFSDEILELSVAKWIDDGKHDIKNLSIDLIGDDATLTVSYEEE